MWLARNKNGKLFIFDNKPFSYNKNFNKHKPDDS